MRIATATAVTPVTVLEIDKKEMLRVLHTEHEFSDRFISYMLKPTWHGSSPVLHKHKMLAVFARLI